VNDGHRVKRAALHAAMAAVALTVAIAPAWGADKAVSSQAQRDYQQERARCQRGDSSQSRATCLKEAAAAYDEIRRGSLGSAPAEDLARNATQRCDSQPAADREACVQRIMGAGNAEGSIGGGGLIRRSETKVP
jgi:hypothetical protein